MNKWNWCISPAAQCEINESCEKRMWAAVKKKRWRIVQSLSPDRLLIEVFYEPPVKFSRTGFILWDISSSIQHPESRAIRICVRLLMMVLQNVAWNIIKNILHFTFLSSSWNKSTDFYSKFSWSSCTVSKYVCEIEEHQQGVIVIWPQIKQAIHHTNLNPWNWLSVFQIEERRKFNFNL